MHLRPVGLLDEEAAAPGEMPWPAVRIRGAERLQLVPSVPPIDAEWQDRVGASGPLIGQHELRRIAVIVVTPAACAGHLGELGRKRRNALRPVVKSELKSAPLDVIDPYFVRAWRSMLAGVPRGKLERLRIG